MVQSASRHISRRRKVAYGLLALLALLLVVLAYLAFVPPNLGALRSQADPAADYAAAVARVSALQAEEAPLIKPACASRLLTHGQRTDRVIVFFHGHTSCPQQFAALGQQFYDLGDNVLLVRLPHHGLADPLTDDLTNLKAEELTAAADQAVDIAAGLGDRVIVAGISGGGVVAAWAGEHRPEVDEAVLIAPAFAVQAIPAPATTLAVNAVLLLPDAFMWWDPEHPGYDPNSPLAHTYPRYSLHGLAQFLRLGLAAEAGARRDYPAAGALLVVTNAHDDGVDNAVTAQVVAAWRDNNVANVRTYEFPAELGLPHDLVDPGQPAQQVAVVYPQLLALINQ